MTPTEQDKELQKAVWASLIEWIENDIAEIKAQQEEK